MPTLTQGDPISVENLAPYRGMWVALRDGKVIASALTAAEVRDDPAVGEKDAILLVPNSSPRSLFL